MSTPDRLRLAKSIVDVSRPWGAHPIGHIIDSVLKARYLPALNRSSRRPWGRIIDVQTGQHRTALPGEIGEMVRRLSGGREQDRQILWNAVQRTQWAEVKK